MCMAVSVAVCVFLVVCVSRCVCFSVCVCVYDVVPYTPQTPINLCYSCAGCLESPTCCGHGCWLLYGWFNSWCWCIHRQDGWQHTSMQRYQTSGCTDGIENPARLWVAWEMHSMHCSTASQCVVLLHDVLDRFTADDVGVRLLCIKRKNNENTLKWNGGLARYSTHRKDENTQMTRHIRPAPRPAFVLRGHAWEVQAIAFHPDGHLLYTGYALLLCQLLCWHCIYMMISTQGLSGVLHRVECPRLATSAATAAVWLASCTSTVCPIHTESLPQVASTICGRAGLGMSCETNSNSADQVLVEGENAGLGTNHC